MEHEGDDDTYSNWYAWNSPKSYLKGLENLEIWAQVEMIQATSLLRSVRKLRRVLKTCGNLLSLKLIWKAIGKRWQEKNLIMRERERGVEKEREREREREREEKRKIKKSCPRLIY